MFLYIGGNDGLYVFHTESPGAAWSPVQLLPTEAGPARIVLHANKKNLYCLHATRPLISAFAIDPPSGTLRLVNRVHAGGLLPSAAALSHDGCHLLVAHAGNSHLGIVPIAADGALGPPQPVIPLPGQTRAQDIVLDPSGRFALLTDPAENKICVLRLNPTSGRASPHQRIHARPGEAPHRAVFHPTMKLLYVSNAGNATVTAYHWDPASGRLSFAQSIRTTPSDWHDRNVAADIAIGPDGRYLYLANRGHDSIAIFAIQPGRGKLFLRARETLGATPHGFSQDARGTLLLAANCGGNSIACYNVILANGMLTRQEPDLLVDRPMAIAVLD